MVYKIFFAITFNIFQFTSPQLKVGSEPFSGDDYRFIIIIEIFQFINVKCYICFVQEGSEGTIVESEWWKEVPQDGDNDVLWEQMSPVVFVEYCHDRAPPHSHLNPYDKPPLDFEYRYNNTRLFKMSNKFHGNFLSFKAGVRYCAIVSFIANSIV